MRCIAWPQIQFLPTGRPSCSVRCMPARIERSWTPCPDTGSTSLKVFQWNVLADGLAQHGDFVKAPQQALDWVVRSSKFLEEILDTSPDIVCLQEVNRYDDFFLPALEKHGYCGAFHSKSCSPAEQYGAPCDGCALFFRADRFHLLHEPQGEAFEPLQEEGGNQSMLLVELLDKLSGSVVIVATTHLKAKAGAKNDALRNHQVKQLLAKLTNAVTVHQDGSPTSLAPVLADKPLLILCGDLNTTPASTTCQLIAEHPLHLKSCWDTYPGISHEAVQDVQQPFSTWKFRSDGESKRIIDYIWYSTDTRWRLTSHWRLPAERDIGDAGLPSLAYPSDHLAICCCFSVSRVSQDRRS